METEFAVITELKAKCKKQMLFLTIKKDCIINNDGNEHLYVQ